ncbi:MAG: thioredoxin family protein [Candidatus Aminicenantes bacterium]|nr:thioredoxin family protein [Candidatus Aminicenantes bacterium]
MKNKTIISFFVLLAASVVLPAQFRGQADVRPLIATQVHANEGFIDFGFQVASGYHITDLKNNFFSIELQKSKDATVERVVFPEGVAYGEEKVFQGKFNVRVYLKIPEKLRAPLTLRFNVAYQICQEFPEELCYPPDQSLVDVVIGTDFIADSAPAVDGRGDALTVRLEKLIRGQLSRSSLLLFILVFAAGFLASLTPCVYPVIPIIMGYVGGRSRGRKLKGFTLSLFFVLGLSLVYSLLGVIAAKTGSLIGISFQNPFVVTVIAAIFIVMGLSLAGLFSIPVPAWISSKVSRSHKNDILGSLLVGGVSAIIAAPCVGPVLIALLSWVSQSGNVFLGFWLTMSFSLGMSVIFLIAGTFSGIISALPKGGGWMSAVKYFFAVLLIAGGIYFLSNIISSWLTLTIWGVFLITLAVGLGLFRPQPESSMARTLAKTLVVLIFLCGAILFYQGLSAHFFPVAAPAPAVTMKSLPWFDDLAAAKEKARVENKRVMIDAWAEWCAACRELDEKTFSRTDVQEGLHNYIPVKLDLTQSSADNERLQKELSIIGMPTVIFLDPGGNEIGRFSGFLDGSRFLSLLDGLKNQ